MIPNHPTPKFMATKVDLDALIQRADFDETTQSPAVSNWGAQRTGIQPRELEKTDLFFSLLRKPDFQRETAEWDASKIKDLITCFVAGDVIPAVILWMGSNGLIYVIDGAHRLSALAAWVNDDYGFGAISKQFHDGNVPEEQMTIHNEVKSLIDNSVGAYESHLLFSTKPDKVSDKIATQAKKLAFLQIPMQLVTGPTIKAETSFRKINAQGVALNAVERKILDNKRKPRGIAARAIIKGGTGFPYWSKFPDAVQKEVVTFAKELNDLLYLPKITYPIKTLELPLGGKVKASYGLTLVWELISIINPPPAKGNKAKKAKGTAEQEAIVELDDSEGARTVDLLRQCRKVVQRILSVDEGSLGLHPAVYCYALNGQYKPASFYALVDLVLKLEATDSFVKFTKVRERLEELLISNDYIVQQIVRVNRGAFKAYPSITKFYLTCIEKLSTGTSVQTTMDEILASDEFGFLTAPSVTLPINKEDSADQDFSTESKSYAYLKPALATVLRCKLCNARLHKNGISTDHATDKKLGGDNSPKNAQPTHPYCNSAKDILRTAVQAAIVGKLKEQARN